MSPSEVVSSLRRLVRASFSIMEQKVEGPLFSRQTQLTRFLCPHQYCYLHSVSIPSPYNHKMLIAPINSQSVCALVCSPGALKVRVKMNCSFILLQERKRDTFPLPRQSGRKLKKGHASFIIIITPSEEQLMDLKSCDLICPFK